MIRRFAAKATLVAALTAGTAIALAGCWWNGMTDIGQIACVAGHLGRYAEINNDPRGNRICVEKQSTYANCVDGLAVDPRMHGRQVAACDGVQRLHWYGQYGSV